MQESRLEIYRSIRRDKAEIEKLLVAMDEVTGGEAGAGNRAHERHTYRNQNCVVHFCQQGSRTPIAYYCPTRNLSKGGISFLHG